MEKITIFNKRENIHLNIKVKFSVDVGVLLFKKDSLNKVEKL